MLSAIETQENVLDFWLKLRYNIRTNSRFRLKKMRFKLKHVSPPSWSRITVDAIADHC